MDENKSSFDGAEEKIAMEMEEEPKFIKEKMDLMEQKKAGGFFPKKEKTKKAPADETVSLLKKQLFYMRATSVAVIALVLVLIVSVLGVISKASTALDNVNEISKQVEELNLSEMNLKEMVDNINDMATESQEAITNATEKLNGVDLETLNEAIQSLNKVVTPLGKFFGRWS